MLDRAADDSWSIVGEPNGRYLWILTRVFGRHALAVGLPGAGRTGVEPWL